LTELPVSLSITTVHGIAVRVFEKGTPLPAVRTQLFTSPKPVPAAVMIELSAGERLRAAGNKRLARLRLGGIKKSIGDIVRIAVKTEVKDDGEIYFDVFDYGSDHKKTKIISPDWIPSQEEIKAAEEEAEKYYEEDCHDRDKVKIIYRAKALTDRGLSLKKTDREKIGDEEADEIKQAAKALSAKIRHKKPFKLGPIDEKTIAEYSKNLEDMLRKLQTEK